ncbi:ornithine decarboxylase-like isoform X1 [Dicentrarchus labrax]|uniref:ornithine decarboxylase-like isoform X1 n=1 Tax=Dicentrarchus labrax TaxID=13489 RepID=UPI0021F68784|nr:ornithine decarboxylase-like isoform X1 [Dicentrarchus labrax]
MEEHTACVFYCLSSLASPVTTNGPVLNILSPENCDIEILDNGRTINDFIDNKIQELGSKDSEQPFYVANLDDMVKKHLRWLTALPRVKPFYALKCNSSPAVLRTMIALGTGFDCASKGEIQLALSLGVAPDKIIYAHTTKARSHIKYARTHGVNMMTFDSEDELVKISFCHPTARLVLRIAVDDTCSVIRLSSKFGARLGTVDKLLGRARELDLDVIGVSFHVGSGCTESSAFKQAIADARHVFDIANKLGFQMTLLDIGGGFPGRNDFKVTFEEVSEVINGALDEYFPSDSEVEIIAEPGRYYVESSFTLAANVIAKRVILDDTEHSEIVENSRDRTMMYYLNDGLYGSLSPIVDEPSYYKFEPYCHRAVKSSEQKYQSIIWGPTCDSTDKLSDDYWLPELHVGDWLLIDNSGAYTVSLCTEYCGFERTRIYPVVTAETWHALNLSHI